MPEQEDLTPEAVAELLGKGEAELVDVREPYEYEAGRIAGARHVALTQLTDAAESIDKERPIVFYCRMGGRSALATQAFQASGYRAYNLEGGLLAWAERGLPLEPQDGKVADH